MKDFFIKRKLFISASFFAGLLLIFMVIHLVVSFKAVTVARQEVIIGNQEYGNNGWNEEEIRILKKNIQWSEQLLLLAKHDSTSLLVNLKDSVVQISLKGVNLLQTKILRQYPADFLNSADEVIRMHYGEMSPIVFETANTPKRQVKKVVAFASENMANKSSVEPATNESLYWKFTTAGNLGIVITGIQSSADTLIFFPIWKDLLKYQVQEFLKTPFPSGFTPTLYLWLDDQDAKAIYRAVSTRGNVLFRD
jgi:hypothetical protein